MITAKELLSSKYGEINEDDKNGFINGSFWITVQQNMIEYGKLCAEEALRLAAKNAKSLDYIDFTNTAHSTKVNKSSILNTPLDFIK